MEKDSIPEGLLNMDEAAKYLGMSVSRFSHYRNKGYKFMEPTYVHRIRNRFYYSIEMLDNAHDKIKELVKESKKRRRFTFNCCRGSKY